MHTINLDDLLNLPKIDNKDIMAFYNIDNERLIRQWLPVFTQGLINKRTLKDALLHYVYPFGENLTKDMTAECTISGNKVFFNRHGFQIKMENRIENNGDVIYMDKGFALINGTQFLKFD